MTDTTTAADTVELAGLTIPRALALAIARQGVDAIPDALVAATTPAQARALLGLAGYGLRHPIFGGG